MTDSKMLWHKVADVGEIPEGRVKTAVAAHKTLCITHYKGEHYALDNKCPHEGGPLGEGSIENGLLRCPWHGWDFDPCTGKSPGDYDDGVDTFPIEVRSDGIYAGLKEEELHVTSISDIMVETMVNWGVKHVFGLVGHSCLGLADAVRRFEKKGKLQFFTVRHEGAAAFAASAYAKLTGKPAACLTIAGPGATNLLTGLWDAKVDRAPVLALTGQVNTQVLGPGAFQDIDLHAAFQSVSAFSQTVLHSSKPAELMNLAIKNAILKRDVTHLIFPDEVQILSAEGKGSASGPKGRLANQNIAPPWEELEKAVKLLQGAKRPILIGGHGARFHREAVIAFAEKLNIPVLTTFKAKSLIPDAHPLACGVLGRSGTPVASWLMNECDVILAVGASFSDHTGISPKKPTIQVDFDSMALGKFHSVEIPLWGELSVSLGLMEKALDGKMKNIDQKADIGERWKIWRAEKEKRRGEGRGKGVNSASIFEALSKHVPEDAVIAVDVGNNTYSFGRYFESRKQSVLMSGYLGSIGFGYPAAMGAWAAVGKDRSVWAVTGDGGFGQYLAEVSTAVKYGMNIKHVLLNNGAIGKIAKEQQASNFDVWQTSLHNPNFADFANNCGAKGIRVTEKLQLEPAFQEAMAHNGPVTVEIISDQFLI